jgi:hypothetical protein
MANNFQNGPGGRLVKALSDTTRVDSGVAPSVYPGKMLPEVVVEAPAAKKGPVVYDEINYLNPFDYKYVVTNGLKTLNTLAGGTIERGGHKRESYSDLTNRLEQTPGTLQYFIKNSSRLPYVNGPLSGPANFGIGAINLAKDIDFNRTAAAVGDVVLDPVNRFPLGRLAKYGLKGAANLLSKFPSRAAAAKRMLMLGNAAPYVDAAGDVIEGAESYSDYKDKPRYEPKEMTPKQEEFLKKLSGYNFGIVK